jgi:hypothetical protein
MNPFARYPRRAAAAAALLLAAAAACTDRSPVGPPDPAGPGEGPGTPGRPVYLMAVTCHVDVKAMTAGCDDAPAPDGPARDLILGGQNRYVNLEMGAVDYNQNSGTYSMSVSVRNLIQQALGTTDGTTLDPNGVRVFLQAGPNATTGTGDVTLAADGLGTFTASNQQYIQYNSVLDQFESSAPRTWAFTIPTTVQAFAFTAYVSAAVQFPDGWVDVVAEPITMHPHAQLKLNATARDAAGNFVTGGQSFTWSSSDTTVATVTPTGSAGGMLGSVRAGTITVTVDASNAAAPTRMGTVQVTVTGMQRVWQGDVSTDYYTRGNWENDVVPVAADSIVIPNPSTNYPVLTANASVAGVQVAEGATISLQAFDLTASRNVVSSTAGGTGITSTTGRLFLTGTAGTVSGRLPRLRVTGTYSLTANISTVAPLQVDAGRLTSAGYRVESISQ